MLGNSLQHVRSNPHPIVKCTGICGSFFSGEPIECGKTLCAHRAWETSRDGVTLYKLKKKVQDAVRCHFEEKDRPSVNRLHLVKDDVIPA
jgi:hypothetical protein